MLNETVMNPAASSTHGPYLGAMNAGASPSDVAAMYLKGAAPAASPAAAGDTTHHHWNVSAMDARSFKDFLVNGGGMDTIAAATNKRDTRYAGDAA